MKTKFLMAIGVLLIITAVIYLSSRSHLAATIASDIISLWFLVLIIGGSIYKLTLWWRYRHDPAKREKVVFSTPLYPSRLRKFFYDEENGAKKN
ncbi:MAG: hypothetical protein V7641_2280 [Blastocatellia bacterium]